VVDIFVKNVVNPVRTNERIMMKINWKIGAILGLLIVGMSTVTIEDNRYFQISKNIEIFTNLYKEINTYYVDDLDPARLMRTGVDAMLESLDPYTNYISETEIESYRYITDGKYNGIGAYFREIGEFVTLMEPFADGPAQKAGLKAGDIVLAVDGQDAKGKSADDVRNILKGFPGTEVLMTVKRPGEASPLKITLIRDEVIVPNVPYNGMVENGIGYFALTTFTRDAGKNVAAALKTLKEQDPNLKGVIFDLRGNGGGLLTEAVNVSNVFIPKGELVVTTKGKVVDWDRSFKTLNQPVDQEIPVVVLIDKGTASASEIVSGVLQDLDRGVLLGQRSYGKGLVQNTRDVGYNSKVKLTTAKYYIPSGRCIQGVEYEDGEPKDIPDDERQKFKTRKGRSVLDGGGVSPDVKLNKSANEDIVAGLRDQFIIFDYVTQYVTAKPEVTDPKTFNFDDWDGFVNFAKQNKFEYETKTEKALAKLRKVAEKQELLADMTAQIQTLENTVAESKSQALERNKAAIVNLIEKDIASRFFFQKGKIEVGLKNDPEIKEAVKILGDPEKYKALLEVN